MDTSTCDVIDDSPDQFGEDQAWVSTIMGVVALALTLAGLLGRADETALPPLRAAQWWQRSGKVDDPIGILLVRYRQPARDRSTFAIPGDPGQDMATRCKVEPQLDHAGQRANRFPGGEACRRVGLAGEAQQRVDGVRGAQPDRRHPPRYEAWAGVRRSRSAQPCDERGLSRPAADGGKQEGRLRLGACLHAFGPDARERVTEAGGVSRKGVAGSHSRIPDLGSRSAMAGRAPVASSVIRELAVFGPQVHRVGRPDGMEGKHAWPCMLRVTSARSRARCAPSGSCLATCQVEADRRRRLAARGSSALGDQDLHGESLGRRDRQHVRVSGRDRDTWARRGEEDGIRQRDRRRER